MISRINRGGICSAHLGTVIRYTVICTFTRPPQAAWMGVGISIVGLHPARREGDHDALEAIPNQRSAYPPCARHDLDRLVLLHPRPCPNLQVVFGVAHDCITPIFLPF